MSSIHTDGKSSKAKPQQEVGDGDMSLGKVPPKSERLKDSEGIRVLKLCGESDWQPRFLCVTAERIVIAHPGKDEISDQIPLHEVSGSDRLVGHGDDVIALIISTIENGYNGGRQYIFSLETEEIFNDWDSFIELQAAICYKKHHKRSQIEEIRHNARWLIKTPFWQYVFGFIIIANFIVNIGQACISVPTISSNSTSSHRLLESNTSDLGLNESEGLFYNESNNASGLVDNSTESIVASSSSNGHDTIFIVFDIIFTTLFALELGINLFGNWYRRFISSGWSIFDFIVVVVSIVSLCVPDGPTWILVLRTMRIFRILRLFNKMRALRTIINALLKAIPIVAQAFIIMMLCVFVFAIVGQDLFQDLNPIKFGTFQVALYTVFEILTLDLWSHTAESVKDPRYGDMDVDPTSSIFFVVCIISCVWILIPVVVAVLVDNFSSSCRAEEAQAIIDEENERMRRLGISKAKNHSPIQPLLESLSKFKNSEDLGGKIQALFKVLDCDLGGTLSFGEMAEGLRKMNFAPAISITQDDFQRMTRYGELCDQDGCLTPEKFEYMMRQELEGHIEHKVASAYEMTASKETPETAALLAAVKLLKMTAASSRGGGGGGGGGGGAAAAVVVGGGGKVSERVEEVRREVLAAMADTRTELLREVQALSRRLAGLESFGGGGGGGGGGGAAPAPGPQALPGVTEPDSTLAP